tara:strand:+ start:390 stop:1526 length:1137 start_codon:yes stop_codon:yes gene_type:complete
MFYSTQGEHINLKPINEIRGIKYDPNFQVSKKILTRSKFPICQEMHYKKTQTKNPDSKLDLEDSLKDLRKAAEIHKNVRKYAQTLIKPGLDALEFCNQLEEMNRKLHDYQELNSGIGFPTGFSINNCAAHFTPTIGDKIIVQENDIIKVDFGSHINGRIIDSAFTFCFNPKYDQLLQASKEATNTGIKEAGIDVRLGELGGHIQETMESFEIELDGKTIPIKSVRNLGGHNIKPYHIHGGKYIPCIKTDDMTKMEEGEIYAVETFATTGSGIVVEKDPTSHYMKNENHQFVDLKMKNYKKMLNDINNKFNTLPFCNKWISQYTDNKNPDMILNKLSDLNIIKKYPPLYDIDNSYVAQYEHTIILKPMAKEVLSKSTDY